MDIADKIELARGEGHGISPHLEDILLSLNERLNALEPDKPKPKEPDNPLNGERIDS